jgi:hypothetical protein
VARDLSTAPTLLGQFWDFPSIPGSAKIIPDYVEKIPGYAGTGIHTQAVDLTVAFGGRPVVLGLWRVKIPVIFPVERELGNMGRPALPIADCEVVAGEGFEPPTLGL